MMGRREDDQVQFRYAFDLDKVVPSDHLVRQIDAILASLVCGDAVEVTQPDL